MEKYHRNVERNKDRRASQIYVGNSAGLAIRGEI